MSDSAQWREVEDFLACGGCTDISAVYSPPLSHYALYYALSPHFIEC